MKQVVINIAVIAFLIISSDSVSAQTDPGDVLLSGAARFVFTSSTTKDISNYGDKVKISTMEFSPQIGVFFLKNCMVGLAIQYNSNSSETATSDSESSSVAAMPVLMFFLGKEQLKPFIYGGAGIGKTKESRNNYYNMAENKQTFFEAGFGIAAFISDKISLDIGASYAAVKTKVDDSTITTNGFGFQAGFSIYL